MPRSNCVGSFVYSRHTTCRHGRSSGHSSNVCSMRVRAIHLRHADMLRSNRRWEMTFKYIVFTISETKKWRYSLNGFFFIWNNIRHFNWLHVYRLAHHNRRLLWQEKRHSHWHLHGGQRCGRLLFRALYRVFAQIMRLEGDHDDSGRHSTCLLPVGRVSSSSTTKTHH